MPKRNHSELASSEPTSVLEVEPLDGEESKKAKHALKMRDWRAKNKANKKMVDPNSGIECDPTVNLEAITLDAYRQRQARKRPKSDLLDQTNKAKTNAEKQLQQEQEESKKAKHALKMRNWRAKNKDNKKMVDPDTGVECDPTVNLRAITLDAHRQRQARKGLKRSSLAQTNKAETKAEKQLAESAAINEAEELNEEAHASSRGHSQPNALVMPTGPSQVPTPALVLESQVIPTPALVLKS
ncbi:MAG TPA: hypothetical protein VLH77_00645, partial [Gammaproteobacteria bacterium]|nr:hypothetical protein [Gammaproteobacteria bacterium]